MTNEQKLAAALAKLGDTADEVAATLGLAGCKGTPGTVSMCPVARYLVLTTGIPRVWVNESSVEVPGDDDILVDLPGPVDDFVGLFDEHEYPDLIQE